MGRRTLFHICARSAWEECRDRGFIGWRGHERQGALDAEVAFFTDDPVDSRAWFTNRKREVVIAVSLPEAMVRPFPEFMELVSTLAHDAEGARRLLALASSPEHVWATPRTIPMKFWRYAQAVDGEILWLPVAA